MACTGCKQKNNQETVANIETTTSFKMRANTGVHQIQFGSGQFISNTNMSDELAIAFLKENPNRISLFEVYPDNWKELLMDKIPTDEPKEIIEAPKAKGIAKRKNK